jgi:hypothetical protein
MLARLCKTPARYGKSLPDLLLGERESVCVSIGLPWPVRITLECVAGLK